MITPRKLVALIVATLVLAAPAFATDPKFGAIRLEATQNTTHAFVSSAAEGANSALVRTSNWNAAHVTPAILVLSVPGDLTWPAMPAAVTEFCGGSTSYRWRANLTYTSTVRLTTQVLVAGPASSALRAQYTTDLTGATGWDYLDGASGPSVAITAAGVAVSSSVNLATAAKADVLLRLVTINGDGGGGTCYSGIKAATATVADATTGLGTADSPQFAGVNVGHATDTTVTRASAGTIAVEGQNVLTAATGQPLDSDLTTIAGLTATSDNFLQAKASAWASRTPTQVTADLISMVGDSGGGGTKGLVPAPASGDAAGGKFLKADGTWTAPPGGGNWSSPFAMTISGPSTTRTYSITDGAARVIVSADSSLNIDSNYTFNAGVGVSGANGMSVATNSPFMYLAGGASASGAFYSVNSNLTPDSVAYLTGSTSNSFHINEYGDLGYDFQLPCTTGLGTAACTDSTLVLHSHNQDTGEFLSLAHDGKAAVIVGGNSTDVNGTLRLGGTVALGEGSATTVVTVPVASGAGSGGTLAYTVFASDATDHQSRSGQVRFDLVNKGGTETCTVRGVDSSFTSGPIQTQDGSGSGSISFGTLTYTWSVDTSGTNTCVLKLNASSSLTQTTLRIDYLVNLNGPGAPTGGD